MPSFTVYGEILKLHPYSFPLFFFKPCLQHVEVARSNPHHSSHPSPCRDHSGSLTHCTRELPTLLFHSTGKYSTRKVSQPFCHECNGMKEGTLGPLCPLYHLSRESFHSFTQAEMVFYLMSPLHCLNKSPDYE